MRFHSLIRVQQTLLHTQLPHSPVDILALMVQSRTLLLFDPSAQPQCWNERMSPSEFAVLYSHTHPSPSDHRETEPITGPVCTVFSTLAEAEEYATQQVALIPSLRCRIYDHQ